MGEITIIIFLPLESLAFKNVVILIFIILKSKVEVNSSIPCYFINIYFLVFIIMRKDCQKESKNWLGLRCPKYIKFTIIKIDSDKNLKRIIQH